MNTPSALRSVLHPVPDVATAIDFYSRTLVLSAELVDGDRYAALGAGGAKLALVGPEEDITDGVSAASFKVASLTETLDRVRRQGGTVLTPVQRGPHETRAAVRDPWGNVFVVYEPS